ncbi:PAS domain-containing sensor histidine kinase [Amaricoccus sp.]|uniref:sensor histidine kinase NtrY-like n=1 Tax=Amaricoccus sp. TaxID=1872485 RepID=UPI001B59F9CF|nr:PAS domain-containing sensor histidine kinase [Amaricoccus sp.]MBP7000737.1 PAS domain-containing sensor histidine kinase [Amaricoccus sp.]
MRNANFANASLRLARWKDRPAVRIAAVWGLFALGPLLALLTFIAFSDLATREAGRTLRFVLLADFVYALVLATFMARRLVEMLAMRRSQAEGSRLHLRLMRVFTLFALAPTLLVAVFATITLNFGLEGWFSERVRNVVANSLAAAQAYEDEHRRTLQADANQLAGFLDAQKERYPLLTGGLLRELLTRGQTQMQRALPRAYVIDGDGSLRARGERSYLFDFIPPTREEIDRAEAGEVVVIEDWTHNEFRALLKLDAFADHYLYVSRAVDGNILSLLDETQATVGLYQQLESDRGRLLFEFALIYIGFALVVILGAIWLALWFAERLARPVSRLAAAAARVGEGDLDVRVPESRSDDEIALLGRAFNTMTRQVKGQRDALIEANMETERRRRLFDSVLSGVTAGVLGLDGEGRVELVNAAAAHLLDIDPEAVWGRPLAEAAPEFADLIARVEGSRVGVAQAEVKLRRAGAERDLLARIATRRPGEEEAGEEGDVEHGEIEHGEIEGYVLSFDDVTDLVVAQRMAAWGDVARRIAHEVKNPLTPIQLSAERLRRKFGPLVGDQREALEQYADVIVRQTGDLRRIVDEFSKFARMPAPERAEIDLARLLGEAVLLQESARPDIRFRLDRPAGAVMAFLDPTMINQALTNLLKNAEEAIEARGEDAPPGEIRVRLALEPPGIVIDIQDNGSGLPDQPARLFEPYVTHRAKGTGLGLPIVKKIVEEHDGTLELTPAPVFEGSERPGAWARVAFPQAASARGREDGHAAAISKKLRESTS